MPNHFEIGQNDLPSDKPPDDEVCDMATGYVDGFERASRVWVGCWRYGRSKDGYGEG